LKQAASLEVLLIYNCGLGSGGAAKIAEGFAGTPKLKTLSIGRNRIEGPGAKSIA
jgi:Ran GTPase-activating protein (RanGAP) involved in mRNA processing and transport